MKYKYLIIISFFYVCLANGQDAHFSQVDLASSFSNPAMSGLMNNPLKLTGVYRTQWAAIPSAFQTYGIGFEQKINNFSWGAKVLKSDAGEASLSLSSLTANVAYRQSLSKEGNALIGGVSIGGIQQRFDPQAFQFDNQYTQGIGFNSDLMSNENFTQTSKILPDVSVGLVWVNTLGKIKNELGISFLHLNQPAASFYENGKEIYPIRSNFYVKSTMPLNKRFSMNGQFRYSKQATAKMLVLGMGGEYKIDKEKVLKFGLANRKEDAFILSAGLGYKNMDFGISYDLQHSKLSGATNGNGAVELSAIFYFKKTKYNELAAKSKETNNESDPLRDDDKDGVPNGVDECPLIPGLWKYNGCNDKDGDGIYDSIDACPNLFGEKSNKGCPDHAIDSDMDGLLDNVDQCPFLKGLPEHKGCPDTDKDGVSDKFDQCPFLKGTIENNGCPKVRSTGVNEKDLVPNNYYPKVIVEFDSDQSLVKRYYYSKLDELVTVLKGNPDTNIYISGHTDTEGDAAYNYELGQRRCFEVLSYFVDHEISTDRINIVSYGEAKPVHTNKHVYGKAKNRRAEVQIVNFEF